MISSRQLAHLLSRHLPPAYNVFDIQDSPWNGAGEKSKQHLVLAPTSARGLLCASKLGQLYSTTLRAATLPYIVPLLGPEQQDAIPQGGTEFPIMIRRVFSIGLTRKAPQLPDYCVVCVEHSIPSCRRRYLAPCCAQTSELPDCGQWASMTSRFAPSTTSWRPREALWLSQAFLRTCSLHSMSGTP